MDALDQMAQRLTVEANALKSIQKARVRLILNGARDAPCAFFAHLAMRLRLEPVWTIQTAATDGKRLIYNPDWVLSLSPDARVGLVCHEVMHNAMCHHSRRLWREMGKANVAMDLAINPTILESRMTLPSGVIVPGSGAYANLPEGLAFEEYYKLLPDGDPGGDGDGNGDPGGDGGVIDAGDAAEQQAISAEWQVAVAQAAQAAKSRGDLPGALKGLVDSVVDPRIPWEEELREFLSKTFDARDDYNWRYPNRRYLTQGLYLPSLLSNSIGHVVVHIDCSGSTYDDMDDFASELSGILEEKPCQVTILYGDTKLQGEPVEWSPYDGPIALERRGGGGTSHTHLSEYLKGMEEAPACCVALTDGYTRWPEDVGVPTLWVIVPGGKTDAPFGRVVELK